MKTFRAYAPFVLFAASLLAIGVQYWLIPYRNVSLPNSLYGVGASVVCLLVILSRAGDLIRYWVAVHTAALAVPAAVFIRVVVEGVIDPTSHNLWPFEIILSLGFGYVTALCGALLGGLIRRLLPKLLVDKT